LKQSSRKVASVVELKTSQKTSKIALQAPQAD
jgi:hypothetical protein